MVTNNALNEPTAASGKVLQGQGVGTTSAFSTATYPATATGTGTILRADGTNWVATTTTYPNTNAINTLLYASSANVMSALATANNGVLTTGTSGIPAITALGSNGQIIIGSGSGAPAAATISAGNGITITNGANTITIAAPGGALTWADNSGTFTAAVANGYFITTTSTPTLPASPAEGDMVAFIIDTTNVCTITGNTNQKIRIGTTLSGAAGTCVNNARGDAVTLVYRTTGTTWFALNSVGTWSIT